MFRKLHEQCRSISMKFLETLGNALDEFRETSGTFPGHFWKNARTFPDFSGKLPCIYCTKSSFPPRRCSGYVRSTKQNPWYFQVISINFNCFTWHMQDMSGIFPRTFRKTSPNARNNSGNNRGNFLHLPRTYLGIRWRQQCFFLQNVQDMSWTFPGNL